MQCLCPPEGEDLRIREDEVSDCWQRDDLLLALSS
jgi:hypothetical protein